MPDVFDLDVASVALESSRARWLARGLDVGPVTWAEGQTTVNPIVTDRSLIGEPWSIGVAVRSGGQEGELILYSYGEADVTYWSGAAADDAVQRVLPDDGRPMDLDRWRRTMDDFQAMFR